MDEHCAVLSVSIRPHPRAAWFHRAFTVPVIEIDGQAHAGRWGRREMSVSAGRHRISAFFRYRGQPRARLAEASAEFRVAETARRIGCEVRLGLRNGSSFSIDGPTAY